MQKKKHGQNVRKFQREAAAERENLEREYEPLMVEGPNWVELITAREARDEPFHRWQRYRQGFSPAFVRKFLDESYPVAGPILDPFNGSGTVTTECGRRGTPAVGVEALPSLAFMAQSRFFGPPTLWQDLPQDADFAALYAAAPDRSSRAAVLFAASGGVDGEGRRREPKGAPADETAIVLGVMREDSARMPKSTSQVICGDARNLPFADGSIGGAVTSPPYLAKYDYGRVNAPTEKIYRAAEPTSTHQIRAQKDRKLRKGATDVHAAVKEIAERAKEAGDSSSAKLAQAYFADITDVLAELARVLAPEAPLWFNVAGADLKRVYCPADLVIADIAREQGFNVEQIVVVRRLRDPLRKLGDLDEVAPREVVLKMRRA